MSTLSVKASKGFRISSWNKPGTDSYLDHEKELTTRSGWKSTAWPRS